MTINLIVETDGDSIRVWRAELLVQLDGSPSFVMTESLVNGRSMGDVTTAIETAVKEAAAGSKSQ